jgi:hypothetical protein
MKLYQKINLLDHTFIGDPAPLPKTVDGLSNHDLSDLTFLPDELGYENIGYYPIVDDSPTFDPLIEKLSDTNITYTQDFPSRTVKAKRTKAALTEQEYTARRDTIKIQIAAKRDAVIDGGLTFANTVFQTRPDDRENISGAAQLAFMSLIQMQASNTNPVGNFRWHGGASDFGWIALDNSVVTMDAPTVISFAKTIAEFKSTCIFYARYLKDQVDLTVPPETVNINVGWPT